MTWVLALVLCTPHGESKHGSIGGQKVQVGKSACYFVKCDLMLLGSLPGLRLTQRLNLNCLTQCLNCLAQRLSCLTQCGRDWMTQRNCLTHLNCLTQRGRLLVQSVKRDTLSS